MKPSPLQTLVAIAVLNTACSNLPEGPGVSLSSKDNRLVGSWEVNRIEDLEEEALLNRIETMEFEEEGDYKVEFETREEVYYGYTFQFRVEAEGEWEWNSRKTEIEVEYVRTTRVAYMGGVDVYEYEVYREFEVLRLGNSELILRDEEGRRWELEKE